jgi:Rieske 2Fe-2S family protein
MQLVSEGREVSWSEGQSLSRSYYTSASIFELEFRKVVQNQWLLVDHISRIPKPGDFFLFDVGRENVIIIRQSDSEIGAFYNVCRHRGSRVCITREGSVKALTCPYHAWSYRLDGSLRVAPMMREGFEKQAHGLIPLHLRVFEGFLFINMSKSTPSQFETFVDRYRPWLEPAQLDKAKVVIRRNYPTTANWKLVVENFVECYHCGPAHATYSFVHDRLKLRALGAGMRSGSDNDIKKYGPILRAWEKTAIACGYPVGNFADGPDSESLQGGGRAPIGGERKTETSKGEPAAPLLGSFKEYDGGRTVAHFNPFSCLFVNNDFAVSVRFTPRSEAATDVEAIWLVREDAVEGHDYDPEELSFVWDTTLREDCVLAENNQLGVNSCVYEPGPHSYLEGRISDFIAWYLRKL